MRTLFSDDIPDPRDIVIVSLASASGVFESMLSRDELAQVRERIEAISGLDLICREIAATIRQLKAQPPPAAPSVRPADEIPGGRWVAPAGQRLWHGREICAASCCGNTSGTGRFSGCGL